MHLRVYLQNVTIQLGYCVSAIFANNIICDRGLDYSRIQLIYESRIVLFYVVIRVFTIFILLGFHITAYNNISKKLSKNKM